MNWTFRLTRGVVLALLIVRFNESEVLFGDYVFELPTIELAR